MKKKLLNSGEHMGNAQHCKEKQPPKMADVGTPTFW